LEEILLKIIFIAQSVPKSGVDIKINAQVANLKKMGLDVNHIIIGNGRQMPDASVNPEGIPIKTNILNQIKKYYIIYKILCAVISPQQKNDIIYIRSLAPNPFTWIAFQFPRHAKIIIEYQTIEPYESKLNSQKFRFFLMDFFFGMLIRRKTDAIVGVTYEITHYEFKRSGDPKKPHITIGNGFNVESVPLRTSRSFNNTELHLLCVANVSIWHGIDRLIKGVSAYHGNINIRLHIAGEGPEIHNLIDIVQELGISHQVIFHGFLTGQKLDELFDNCHIAVGSLGIHRKGLHQTSELKAREYCARGIPYIIACGDPDFPADFPYILEMPADESPIDMEQIIAFVPHVCQDTDHPQKMRHYALKHLDWSVKMKKTKEFLEDLTNEDDKKQGVS